jgi:hypothetical protein
MEPAPWRDYLANAIRYWEPRRILYNLLLAAIVVIHFCEGTAGFQKCRAPALNKSRAAIRKHPTCPFIIRNRWEYL